MKKMNKTALLLLLGVGLIISSCLTAFYWAGRPTPSRSQLCANLAEFIEKTKCLDMESTDAVLIEAFRPHEATREEIKDALGNYHYDSFESPNGSVDYYELHSSWLRRKIPFMLQESYVFSFDKNEILEFITVND